MKFPKIALLCLIAVGTSACDPHIATLAAGHVVKSKIEAADQQDAAQEKLTEKQAALYKSVATTKAVMYDGKKVEVLSMATKRVDNADVLTQCEIKMENGLHVTVDGSSNLLAPVL